MRWDNHTHGDRAGEYQAMVGRMSWVGSEQDSTDIIQRRSVHQSNLLHRVGEALGEEGKQPWEGLTCVCLRPMSSAQTNATQDEVANSKSISCVFYSAKIILIDVQSREVLQSPEEIQCFCLWGIWKYLLFSVFLRQNNHSL